MLVYTFISINFHTYSVTITYALLKTIHHNLEFTTLKIIYNTVLINFYFQCVILNLIKSYISVFIDSQNK